MGVSRAAVLALLVAPALLSVAFADDGDHSEAFLGFMKQHKKDYCNGADKCQASLAREKIFWENMKNIDAHNANPSKSFSMKASKFADLHPDEFAQLHLKYRPSEKRVAAVQSELNLRDQKEHNGGLGLRQDDFEGFPKEFSWLNPPPGYGKVVGPVHDQQDVCASCWAFVTADSIAGRWAVKNKKDIEELSVKQLMVCDHTDNGCNTGNMYTAYDWIGDNGGIATRAAYDAIVPGEIQDDETARCAQPSSLSLTTPGMCDLKMTDGNVALMTALKERGPVAIGINANNLQFYSTGIINADSCPPAGRGIQSINHAALIVGWGEENTLEGEKKYWLVKNSYGSDFGESGYFKLERASPNPDTLFSTCGLLFESVYPVVVSQGGTVDDDEPCSEGSVFKADYYRNEADNPGANAAAAAQAQAQAQLGASLAAVVGGRDVQVWLAAAAAAVACVVVVVGYRHASGSVEETSPLKRNRAVNTGYGMTL